jgi:hypothetical protein
MTRANCKTLLSIERSSNAEVQARAAERPGNGIHSPTRMRKVLVCLESLMKAM